jgi:hypothetical protein
MKSKSIIIALAVLILACSVTAIAAESASVGDYTFDYPDDFKVNSTSDTQAVFEKDNTHAIVVLFSDSVASSDDAKTNLESKGYEFLGENTYDAEGYSVTQQNFEKDGLTVYSYNFQMKDGKYCVITYTIPSSEQPGENEDNPITEIIKTLK